ncbi:MAG: N-acetyltransferase family protein [Caulobacteraceae bacterium]
MVLYFRKYGIVKRAHGPAARPALREDAAAIVAIYNQGIEDRIATFETEPRTIADIMPWFEHAHAFVSVAQSTGEVVGYAVAHPYSDRCCYRGIGEFSVYVRRSHRGRGVGQAAMAALIAASRADGLWKLMSRVFPENRASLSLMARMVSRRSASTRSTGSSTASEGLRDRRAVDPRKHRLTHSAARTAGRPRQA